MFRIKTIVILLVLMMLMSSCAQSLSDDELPDLGINIDELELNTYIRLTAPKQLNEFKPGSSISLEVANISENDWYFNITKDILIYEYKDKEWKKVSDKMINIGETELTLGPKGKFPLDKRLVGVLPDVKLDQSTSLRIFLLVHRQTLEKEDQVKGAFLDLLIRP